MGELRNELLQMFGGTLSKKPFLLSKKSSYNNLK